MSYNYKDRYEHELQQRNELRGATSTPIGLLSALGAALAFMIQKADIDAPGGWVLLAFAAVCAGLLVVGAYFLIKAMHGHTYKAVEAPDVLRKHHSELVKHYTVYGSGQQDADDEFLRCLEDSYVKAASHNFDLNVERYLYLHLTNRWIFIAAIGLVITAIPFILNVRLKPAESHRVEIYRLAPDVQNQIKGALGEREKSRTTTTAAAAASAGHSGGQYSTRPSEAGLKSAPGKR